MASRRTERTTRTWDIPTTPPPYVMAQMGHTTANLTLAIYARQMDRRDGEPERLKSLVNGEDWAQQPAPAAVEGHPLGTQAPEDVEVVRA